MPNLRAFNGLQSLHGNSDSTQLLELKLLENSLFPEWVGKKSFLYDIVETQLANSVVPTSGKILHLCRNTLCTSRMSFLKNNHNTPTEWGHWFSCVWYKVILKAEPGKGPQTCSELGQCRWDARAAPQGVHVKSAVSPMCNQGSSATSYKNSEAPGYEAIGNSGDHGKVKIAHPTPPPPISLSPVPQPRRWYRVLPIHPHATAWILLSTCL